MSLNSISKVHNYVIDPERFEAWRPLLDTNGARRRLSAVRRNEGIAVYPGAITDRREFFGFTELLTREANSIGEVKVDSSGVLGPDAIPGNFNALLTTGGYGMNPISVPPVSNQKIRDDLKLVKDFLAPRHREIFRQLTRLMFSRSAPAGVPIRREASTGSPDYVNDVVKKKRELRAALSGLDRFLELVDREKFLDLFVEFNAPIVQTTGERTQADKATFENGVYKSKDREVNDELAARSGLREGSRKPADKRVIVNGTEVKNHFAGRRRTVFGMSFVPNYVLAAFCASWRAVYLREYEFTWKHRTPEHILGKMKRYRELIGFDVKQFDQTVPTFMIREFCKELTSYADRRVAKLIWLMFRAPYIVPYPWIYGTSGEPFDPLFGDDPFSRSSFKMELGLPSGIAINPDFGKLVMTFQYLCVLDDYHKNVLEIGIDKILKGEHDQYGILNMGDDCVLLFNDSGFRDWYQASYVNNYFFLEEEKPISFLGNVPYRDAKGELCLAPNVISYLVNWLVPERGIDHPSRQYFWAVGDRERRAHYAIAPRYTDVFGVFKDTFQFTYGVSPTTLTEEAYRDQKRYTNLSSWDALVLQNPDYLHYRVDPTDITPDILDIIVTTIPPAETWPAISKFTDKRLQEVIFYE